MKHKKFALGGFCPGGFLSGGLCPGVCSGTEFVNPQNSQVIPGHGNPQKRRTIFGGYLFKYCRVKYQTFHAVCEKASQ